MFRQRVNLRHSPAELVGRLLVLLLAAALFWYGLMLVLLAVKVSPSTVNALSGYRAVYDKLAAIGPSSITATDRLVVAGGGLLLFLILGYLAFKAIPKPTLARGDVNLAEDERGEVRVQPRAIERIAETAASQNAGVASATGRLGDELDVMLTVRRPREVAETLRAVQGAVREALAQHELPALPVNVTLTGIDRTTRRSLE